MLDAVIDALVASLVERILNDGCQVLKFHKQFKILKEELQFMQGYLKDVEKVRIKDRNETLKVAVGLLRELLYNAEDIISDCELFLKLERRKRESKFMRYCSPSFWRFHYQMGNKLGAINKEILGLRGKMSFYLPASHSLLNQHLRRNRTMTYPVSMNDGDMVGLDNDAEKIKQWVLKPHGSLNVVGIVGMGGIGKTTLAHKIYSDVQVKNFFDDVLMVIVSRIFKLEDLIKNMLKKLDVSNDFTSRDVQGLLEELRDRLEGKKCLVILDDVWRQDEGWSWWESLKSYFPRRNCCVIVTSRDDEVGRSMGVIEAHIHHPQLLSNEDSWSLFTKIAFTREGGRCPNLELEHIGREIVNRCGGLPLAIKVVGGMMIGRRCSINEWGRISKNLKEELAKTGEPIFSVLELSFEDLPSYLKSCMLCLAAFPEDHEIFSNEIIQWWISEGFVQRRDGQRIAYDIAKDYLAELHSRGLLIGEEMNIFERNINSFRIHDMIRDMIREIAKEENFICFDDRGRPSCTGSRRVGLLTATDLILFKEETNFKLLRTIIGEDIEEEEFIRNLGPRLFRLKWLKVLNIRFQYASQPLTRIDWLSGIGSLQHLVCLVIKNSRLESLPNSIGNLHSLQILHISNCPNLKRIPKNIASLEKLTTLNLIVELQECLPAEIGNLQQLCIFALSTNSKFRDGFRISGLKKLTQLRELRLRIASEDEIEEGELKVLSELTQLELMGIRFPPNCNDVELLERKVNHELSPIHQLSELYLWNYPGNRTPIWLNPTSLPNLHHLFINKGNIAQMSPEFFPRNEEDIYRVWRLEVLVLFQVPELEEEWPRMQRAMPFLKILKVVDCPSLKSLPYAQDAYGRATWRRK